MVIDYFRARRLLVILSPKNFSYLFVKFCEIKKFFNGIGNYLRAEILYR